MNDARPERRAPGRTHYTDLELALRSFGACDAGTTAAVRDVVADVSFDDVWMPRSRGYVALARAGVIQAWIHPGFVDVRSGPGGARRIPLPRRGPASTGDVDPGTMHDGDVEETAMTTGRRPTPTRGERSSERLLGTVRRERIAAAVRVRGVVTVADLVRDLGVSEMTVRRDLAALAERGLLHRVHGGATSARGQGAVHVPRPGPPRAGDDALAEVAVRLIEPGGVVALGSGTATPLLAERIVSDPRLRPLTVLTSSTVVARVVDSAGDGLLTAILTGGTRTASGTLVGPLARRAFGEIPSRLAFVDACRITSETGVADLGHDEADVSRAMVENADRVVVLASRSAWRPGGRHPIASLDEVDVLVTDDAAPARERERAGSAVGRLLLAPAGAALPARRRLVRD